MLTIIAIPGHPSGLYNRFFRVREWRMSLSSPTRREVMAVLLAAPVAGLAASPTQWTLQQASEQIRAKKISPEELTRTCLDRIELLNPRLNAFITVMAEQAMTQARAMEAELQTGKWRGPLHGIPIGLKDLFDTAGVKTTCASAVFADRIPSEDAEVVVRLKRAGAVLIGKQNMHEFAYGATSVPSHFGPVHNPWNPGRIAGGSSGGSAAAVAAGLCFGALGSDTGGSIRQPAAYCGITGIKPTYGRVSTRGVVPLSWSLDHVGPLCRNAADAALLLEAIAGYDSLEPNSVDYPVERYSMAMRAKTSALRTGVVRRPFFEQLDPQIETAVNTALEVIAKLTAGIGDAQLPTYPTLPITGAEAYAFHLPYFSKTPELYQPMTRQRIAGGATVTAAAYIEARRELDRLRRSVGSVFSNVDLLITPTSPLPQMTIEEGAIPEVPPPGAVSLSLRNTYPFDIFGLPTVSIPCGFARDGMPIGLQITGPRFGESRVLALAHAYQQMTDWHLRRPSV
jgi:aspartyl-tRNA(Asn)/glutamyl-tRNA(Gln) amidotransferase subunit A